MTGRTHYIYEIWDSGKLLYTGRTILLRSRWRLQQKKYPDCIQKVIAKFDDFGFAAMTEKALIAALRPPLNKYVASSPCMLGRKQSSKQKISAATKLKGIPLTEIHKRKLWENRSRLPEANPFYGKNHTEETRDKLRKATKDQFKDPEKVERHRLACLESIARRKAAGVHIGRHKEKIRK